eukprot:3394955-Amphidinium_carterae.1
MAQENRCDTTKNPGRVFKDKLADAQSQPLRRQTQFCDKGILHHRREILHSATFEIKCEQINTLCNEAMASCSFVESVLRWAKVSNRLDVTETRDMIMGIEYCKLFVKHWCECAIESSPQIVMLQYSLDATPVKVKSLWFRLSTCSFTESYATQAPAQFQGADDHGRKIRCRHSSPCAKILVVRVTIRRTRANEVVPSGAQSRCLDQFTSCNQLNVTQAEFTTALNNAKKEVDGIAGVSSLKGRRKVKYNYRGVDVEMTVDNVQRQVEYGLR